MKAINLLAVAAVIICLLSLLTPSSFASHHHRHQEKIEVKAPPTNTFDSSNLVRFSYSTECPKDHHKNHNGKHQEDKSLACREEKYVFDRAQTLISHTTKASTKYALISPSEFERIVDAVSFYQGQNIDETHGKADSVAKHEIKIYWNNHITNETAVQNSAAKRNGIFMDLGKTAESAKHSYYESQRNQNQNHLDRVVANIASSKKWVDLPTNPKQIECIKWIRMMAKTDEEIGLLEKYLYFYDSSVKHVMFIKDLASFSVEDISTKPLMTEYGHLNSDYLVHKTMQEVIDSNLLFADSVYGQQNTGHRGVIVQINWKPHNSHKTQIKNITIWDYVSAPEKVKSFEFKMRVLKSDIKYKSNQDDVDSIYTSFLQFVTNWWRYLSYGFIGLFFVAGMGFLVISGRRDRDTDKYLPMNQDKKGVEMVFVKEDEEALIGDDDSF